MRSLMIRIREMRFRSRARALLALAPVYYVAMILGLAPPSGRDVISAAVVLVFLFPIALPVFIYSAFFLLPSNFLDNLSLETSQQFRQLFSPIFIVVLLCTHFWFLRGRRYVALGLLAVLLLVSSYNCGAQISTI